MKKDKKTPEDMRKPTIFSLLVPYKKNISLLLTLTVLSSGLGLLLPKIISRAIDSYTSGNYDLNSIMLEFGIVIFLIFIFTYLQSIYQVYASEIVAKDLREKLVDKISRQNYTFIEKLTPSKLLTNLTSDIDSIKIFVSQAIVSLVSSVIIIL
jgi:ATP-binding cassette subfamily B protein